MKSIRTKVTVLTVFAIAAAMAITTFLGAVAIQSIGEKDSEQLLLMLCQTGQKNLDHYFESVEQSVEMVSSFVKQDLDGLDPEHLKAHVDRARVIFGDAVSHTHGVLTYYYRIDPSVSEAVKGFWYTNLDGNGFEEHEVTDITLYDTEDTNRLVWFTVPKYTREAVWLLPYFTDNLDVQVMSYNVPVYFQGTFAGVLGIEIEAADMKELVNSIQLYKNGYAFINDMDGNLIYHPRMSEEELGKQQSNPSPSGINEENTVIRYNFEGVEKIGAWLPLCNGTRLNVIVPVGEINAGWKRWINSTVLISLFVLAVISIVTMHLAGRITKPLKDLAEAAEQVDRGNYDVTLSYDRNDEIGTLSRTFNLLISHLKTYIRGLKDLAYGDALTAVRNKGAFDISMRTMQERIDLAEGERPEFAIVFFDCNNLKAINDQYGHDKGDLYLKRACKTICQIYAHSPVFRIGGDEFAAILQNSEYEQREALLNEFDERCFDLRAMASVPWESIDVARGMAVYDPNRKETAEDVVRRADEAMYQNKRETKQKK